MRGQAGNLLQGHDGSGGGVVKYAVDPTWVVVQGTKALLEGKHLGRGRTRPQPGRRAGPSGEDGGAGAEVVGGGVTVVVVLRAVRAGLALAWLLHLVPAEPAVLDLALSLPVMDTTRARTELGWVPRHSSVDAMQEMLEGLREGAGLATPPLRAGRAAGRRGGELSTGSAKGLDVPAGFHYCGSKTKAGSARSENGRPPALPNAGTQPAWRQGARLARRGEGLS